MIYAYLRVSTDKQTAKNQRFEINSFCKKNHIKPDKWIAETISGTKDPIKRKLGGIMGDLKKGDLIICTELSRLGRSLFMIMDILSYCMKKDVNVWTIKDNFRLGDDVSSKVLAFAFGLSAEIERNLISQRTSEALKRIQSEGKHIGRSLGSKNKHHILDKRIEKLKFLRGMGVSKTKIAKMFGCHRVSVSKYCIENNIV